MKQLAVLTALTFGTLLPVQAQLFTPESFTGAAVGGITGALLGGRHPGGAAAIGAGSGFLLGSLLHESRRGYYAYAPYGYGYYGPPYAYGYPNYAYPVQAAPGYYADPKPAVNQAPEPMQQISPAKSQPPPSAMSSANSLFGR